jgi:hypothetical protein
VNLALWVFLLTGLVETMWVQKTPVLATTAVVPAVQVALITAAEAAVAMATMTLLMTIWVT